MFQSKKKKKIKKRRKRSKKKNENKCSMNYLDHFLMSTRTTFHLPTYTRSTRNQENNKKKGILEPKEEKKIQTNKQTKKKITNGE